MLTETLAPVIPPSEEYLISIRDVARIIGVPPHTIRYWEREFSSFLAPPRTGGKQRRYGDGDIERLRAVRRMLKEEGYSIAGAKRALVKREAPVAPPTPADEGSEMRISREMAERILEIVKEELRTRRDPNPLNALSRALDDLRARGPETPVTAPMATEADAS